MNLFMGIDPDLHTIPLAILSTVSPESDVLDGPIFIAQIEVPKKFKETAAVIQIAKQLGLMGSPVGNPGEIRVHSISVENQSLQQARTSGANPNDILKLGQVGGMLLMSVASLSENLYFPDPQKWKGSVPKPIHQARVCKRLGWQFDQTKSYSYPVGLKEGEDYIFTTVDENGQVTEKTPRKTDWKHIVDSIGLAFYAKDVFTGKKRYRV